MAQPVNNHHSIDYIEFSVLDMAAAKSFYEKVFGWRFNDYGPDYSGIQGYAGEQGDAREVGGFAKVDQMTNGGPLVVLYSNNLEESRESVIAAGGTISTDIFSFPGGRRFHFVDPSGNELAVWTQQ